MANMRKLIRILFIIFIVNGIVCLGGVCDNCCDCFKEKKEDKKEEIKEYEEIEENEKITAISLVNNNWFKTKEKNLVLKIFKNKEDKDFQSKDNGDKILIKFGKDNNPKITYQNENEHNLEGEKYAFFEIKTQKGETVYLYCNDVESGKKDNWGYGIFEETTHVSISVIACDTTNVRNMRSMFHNCNSLTKLDLKNFNTSKVTNMGHMFSICSGLTELDLKNFDTTNVTNMKYMFFGCSSLTEIDLKNFNTTNVSDMNGYGAYVQWV